MTSRRLLFITAVIATLLIGVAGANAESSAEPAFTYQITDYKGVYNPILSSSITATLPDGTGLDCSSISDPKCAPYAGSAKGKGGFTIMAILPPCPINYGATDICIQSLKTADATGLLQNATLVYEANTKKFPKDTKYNLPAGGGASVWRGSSAVGGSVDYAVIVTLREFFNVETVDSTKPIRIVEDFSARVVPVKIISSTESAKNECLILETTRCAYPEINSFAEQKIELTLQMDNALTGWVFGRMKDAKVSSTPLSKNTNLLIVEGKAINVPNGGAEVKFKEISTGSGALQTFFNWPKQKNVCPDGCVFRNSYSNNPFLFIPDDPALRGNGIVPIQAIEPWLKTTATTPTWSFGAQRNSAMGLDNSTANKLWSCTVSDTSKLHGFMSTNAMAAIWSPPNFVDGFLNYKVAGAHFDIDGSVFKGTYSLSMDADSAKCIYGFTDAPIQATVSVTKADGETTNIATELVSIDKGWLNLSANNFTFSDPTIKIKLTQEKAATKPTSAPTPSPIASDKPSPTPSQAAIKKFTITCVKGKLKKVVSSERKPVCPAGYKLK